MIFTTSKYSKVTECLEPSWSINFHKKGVSIKKHTEIDEYDFYFLISDEERQTKDIELFAKFFYKHWDVFISKWKIGKFRMRYDGQPVNRLYLGWIHIHWGGCHDISCYSQFIQYHED